MPQFKEGKKPLKQIVVLSGKGGTGKTSLAAAFSHLSSTSPDPINAVFADADVDAANLSLVLHPKKSITHEFWGGSLAKIDASLCTGCGACMAVCRYDAIFPDANNQSVLWIDPIACDGCAACVYACQQNAVRMVPQQEGHWFQSKTPYGPLFHAELFAGKENSGKLVTIVKQHARLLAEDTGASLVIVDGPPGIGCPVISACAGADLGVIITEPGLAGLHDLKRVLLTLQHFKIPSVIGINKADIYRQGTQEIQTYAKEKGIEIMGEIPFDDLIPRAMLMGAPVTEAFPESQSARAIQNFWKKVIGNVFK